MRHIFTIRRRHTSTAALLLLIIFAAACGSGGNGTPTPGLPNGVSFTDPEGTYQMVISDEWVASNATFAAGIEMWFVAEPVDGFTSNVNVLTQPVPTDMALEDYLNLSIESAPGFIADFRLIRQEVVTGRDGQPLALMEYVGSPQGSALHFLGVFGLGDGEAVVATLSTPPETYERLAEEIEPYLLTLLPTS